MSGIYFEKNPNAMASKRVTMNKTTATRTTYTTDDRRNKQLKKEFPAGTYTVVKPVNLRHGADVNSERLRRLNKGEKVEVAEVILVKNVTRARITSPAPGWTSMVSSKGIQCLARESRQIGEKTWDDIKKQAQDSGKGVVGMDTWNELKNSKKASNLSAKHDKISKAATTKRQVPESGKTKACPECGTRFDACWGQCPNCNGELATTWKDETQVNRPPSQAQQKQRPAQQQQRAKMQRQHHHIPQQSPQQAQQVSYNPTYQIMYQPVYQHMAQPTFQIDMSQQAPTLQHAQHTNVMFPQQMYQGATPQMPMYAHMQQPVGTQQNAQPQQQQFVQAPMQQQTAVPQIQYMSHAQQAPVALPSPSNVPGLVRGSSLLQEAFQGMKMNNNHPPAEMAKLSVNEYVNELEAATPQGNAGDVFRGPGKQELPGLTYYPINGQMAKPMTFPEN